MNFDPNTLKDPSKLPKSIRFIGVIAAFVVSISAGYFYDTDPQQIHLNELQVKEQGLRNDWKDKKAQAVNLDAYKKQLSEVEVMFGALLKQLPNRSEMDALLNDINQAGVGRGLVFDYFRPSSAERPGDYYSELPVSIAITGTYHELSLFAEDVSKLTRIVNLDDLDIRIADTKATPVRLALTATAKTYRYLDKGDKKK